MLPLQAATVNFVGNIDEVRLWSVARTQAQILATAVLDTIATPAPSLLGYWAFNEPIQRRVCASELIRVYDQV